MIDLKLLRASPAQVRAAVARRGDPSLTRLLDEIEALDMKRRTLTAQLDTLKAERNDAARTDAQLAKAQGKLPDDIVAARRKLGERITSLESELRQIETTLDAKALFVPNSPLPEVPDEQTVLRSWGTPAPKGGKPHWEIAERLGILDLPRGAKLAGSGFPVLMGAGARLARGLINFAPHQERRLDFDVAVLARVQVQHEVDQASRQSRAGAHQHRESRARELGAARQIENAKLFGDLPMRFAAFGCRRSPAPQHRLLFRHVGQRRIRDEQRLRFECRLDLPELGLQTGDPLTELPPCRRR